MRANRLLRRSHGQCTCDSPHAASSIWAKTDLDATNDNNSTRCTSDSLHAAGSIGVKQIPKLQMIIIPRDFLYLDNGEWCARWVTALLFWIDDIDVPMKCAPVPYISTTMLSHDAPLRAYPLSKNALPSTAQCWSPICVRRLNGVSISVCRIARIVLRMLRGGLMCGRIRRIIGRALNA